jgi:Fe-S-cluster containining protein
MPDWRLLNQAVQTLHTRFDRSAGDWFTRFAAQGGRLYCGRGCSGCCTLTVNATLPEAVLAAEVLSAAQADALRTHIPRLLAIADAADLKNYLRRQRQEVGLCPFLAADGACGIYACRPLACRSLYSTRPADYCATDFANLHPLEKQAFLSTLDRDIVAFPTHYAAFPRDLGLELEGELIWRMREVLGFSLTGSFPLLVWLVREKDLLAVAGQGVGAVRKLLAGEGLESPFLLGIIGADAG